MTSQKQRKQILEFLKEKCDVVDVIFSIMVLWFAVTTARVVGISQVGKSS